MSKITGKFFWYDLMTTDTAAAAKFYGHVVGWGAQDSGVPDSGYTLFTVGGQGRLGFMRIPEDARKAGVPPCWMGYIGADDVDKAAAELANSGGTVHKPPQDVPGVIRFAVVGDPQGAGFLVAKGLVHASMPELPHGTLGTIGWHELHAADWTKTFPFYAALFGWQKRDAVDMGAMGTYQVFATGDGDAVGGMMNDSRGMPFWLYYICVEEIQAAAARVKDAGGQVLNGPHEVPGGAWVLQGRDPQGAMFALTGPRAP